MYVANTEAGAVLELRLPGLARVRSLRLFSLKEHLNSVAPLEPGVLWGILHNLGAVRRGVRVKGQGLARELGLVQG